MNTAHHEPKAKHPLADAPDVIIESTKVIVMCYVCRKPIPEGVDEVVLRSHDSQHGYGGETMIVAIRRSQGE